MKKFWIPSFLTCCISAVCHSDIVLANDVPPRLLELAEVQSEELANYWVSEKLDGIRAIWTGTELLTRKGKRINAPDWFTRNLPSASVEGELWAGRGNFNLVQKTVLDQIPDETMWREIAFVLFDMPNRKENYRTRYEALSELEASLNLNHVSVIKQSPIQSYSVLLSELESVNAKGGEGLMLMPYLEVSHNAKRVIKLKRAQDSEGVVVGYKAGKGKYKGMIGALLVKIESGETISLGSGLTDKLRSDPPPLGEQVTYRYNGYTSTGLPRFARFLRIRKEEQ
jgi:DNA ligase-1